MMLKTELTDFIQSIIRNNPHSEEAFYVLDLGEVVSLMDRWTRNLPAIRPFYAVKCNPDPKLLEAMAALGVSFDCASQVEIKSILSLGVSPDRIIYANPCKQKSHIKYAASVGVKLATFDSVNEVEKIRTSNPKCELLIRIKAPEDGNARFPLGGKFGALPEEFKKLLLAAQDAKLTVTGVSFHIGSGATSPHAYRSAVALAKSLFDMALKLGLPPMHLLDIGGGFNAGPGFEETANAVKLAIQDYFHDISNLKVIAEPGRYFSETAVTLVASIIGKRIRGDLREYWISDGVYGSFNFILHDHKRVIDMVPLAPALNHANRTCHNIPTWHSTVFGPTLDALDKLVIDRKLPELEVDDWMIFPNMGAYDAALRTNFNGFEVDAITTHVLEPLST